jgi:dihydrofolate reductase
MIISQIVAVSLNNVIGVNNGLPWHMPADVVYFKDKTWGHYIVTGRRNYEAEGRALPGRVNIVLTRNPKYKLRDAIVVHWFEEAIKMAKKTGEDELFVVGGEEIYKLAMPFTNRIYLTRILANFDGDTFYLNPDPETWKEVSRIENKKDADNPYDFSFIVFERRKS